MVFKLDYYYLMSVASISRLVSSFSEYEASSLHAYSPLLRQALLPFPIIKPHCATTRYPHWRSVPGSSARIRTAQCRPAMTSVQKLTYNLTPHVLNMNASQAHLLSPHLPQPHIIIFLTPRASVTISTPGKRGAILVVMSRMRKQLSP